MNKATWWLSLALVLGTSDCDPQKQNERIGSLEAEVRKLKNEVADLRQKQQAVPAHHYELRNEGFRTFRFDPATGDTCIQLTTPADWKRKETKAQSCGCTDAMEHWSNMTAQTEQERKWADGYYKHVVEVNCGPD